MSPPKIKVRGAARGKGIPTGYILGRTSRGHGDVQLLNLRELNAFGVGTASGISGVATSHGFGFFAEGLLASGEILGAAIFAFQMTFTNGDPGVNVTALTGAASTATFNLNTTDALNVPYTAGTIVFAAGSTTGVVSWVGGALVLAPGKALQLVAPSPADAALSSISGIVTGSGG